MKKRIWRRLWACLTAAVLSLSLCGCERPRFVLSPQELYALPELPPQYTDLNSQLGAILESGAEYAAPTSGAMVQSVQMVDLDSDGAEEAVAFFRRSEDEKPLKIVVFKTVDGVYQRAATIEGSGSSIATVSYADLNSDGRTEIIVGWRVNAELQALSVYALRLGSGKELLRPDEVLKSVSYVKFAVTDLDQNGLQEVVILRSDEEGSGLAEFYSWSISGALSQSATALSMSMAELSRQGRLTQGVLSGGVSALFITGVTEQSRSITDILTLQEGEFNNILLSSSTGVTRVISDYYGLYPTDIDSDGLTEVPIPVELPAWNAEEEGRYHRIDWMRFDTAGSAETMYRTYHDMENRWYFRLPAEWTETLMVSRAVLSDESIVTFYHIEGAAAPQPFLRIAAITGPNRAIKAVRGERFILSRQMETTYTAELLESEEDCGLTPDLVRERFSIIATEWTAE